MLSFFKRGPRTRLMKLHAVIAWMATGYLVIAWLFPPWEQASHVVEGKYVSHYKRLSGPRFILTPPEVDLDFEYEVQNTRGSGRKGSDVNSEVIIDREFRALSFTLVLVVGLLLLALRGLDWLLRKRATKPAPESPEPAESQDSGATSQ